MPRTEKRRDQRGALPLDYPGHGLVNYYYCYCVDSDSARSSSSAARTSPTPANCASTGTTGPTQLAARDGIAFEALDNGFAAVGDPARCRRLERLRPEQIDALLRKWLALLPHPFTPADRQAGYRDELSILQVECSLTQMLDKPTGKGSSSSRSSGSTSTSVGRTRSANFERRLWHRARRDPRAVPHPGDHQG